MTEIRNMYEVYHEMDLAHFVERLDELWNQHYPETNLKRIRDLAGLSQRELAELSGYLCGRYNSLSKDREISIRPEQLMCCD